MGTRTKQRACTWRPWKCSPVLKKSYEYRITWTRNDKRNISCFDRGLLFYFNHFFFISFPGAHVRGHLPLPEIPRCVPGVKNNNFLFSRILLFKIVANNIVSYIYMQRYIMQCFICNAKCLNLFIKGHTDEATRLYLKALEVFPEFPRRPQQFGLDPAAAGQADSTDFFFAGAPRRGDAPH